MCNGCNDRYKNVCFQLYDESDNELSTTNCTTGVYGEPYLIADIIEVDYNYTRNVKKIEITFNGGEYAQISELFVDVGTGNKTFQKLIITLTRDTGIRL